MEPFAVEIYRRFLAGETLAELAQETGIPYRRIEQRLRAACRFYQRPQAPPLPRRASVIQRNRRFPNVAVLVLGPEREHVPRGH